MTAPVKRGPGRPRKVVPPPQPALIEREDDEQRPTEHNGIPVVREELIMHLPKAPFKISRLHLADGSMAFSCRDCQHTGDSRGEVMVHRYEAHGAALGKKPPKVEYAKDTSAPDVVLPPRENGPLPSNPQNMTLGEFLALAPSIAALGDLVDRAETERDEALALLGNHRTNQTKIDGYDEMQGELTAARIQLRQQANYEAIKAEMYELRKWKVAMIKKLSGLGFHLSEED
jgi:hypothetical protein